MLNPPSEITSFEDFTQRALNFDFYTAMSDDHRVYLAGRRAGEVMDAYAADNELAAKLWKFVKAENAERFFVNQLMHRVEATVLESSLRTPDSAPIKRADSPAYRELRKYVIGYLAKVGKDSHIGASARDAIGKYIGAPSAYIKGRKEEREKMIDDFIENPY
jgi:hypothetical protein